MEITYYTEGDKQLIRSEGHISQVIKLKPDTFHNRDKKTFMVPVPGYSIILMPYSGYFDKNVMATHVEHFLNNVLGKSKSSIGHYKKYQLDDQG